MNSPFRTRAQSTNDNTTDNLINEENFIEKRERSTTHEISTQNIKNFIPRLKPKKASRRPSPFKLRRCNRNKMPLYSNDQSINNLSFVESDDIESLNTNDVSFFQEVDKILKKKDQSGSLLFERREMSSIRYRLMDNDNYSKDYEEFILQKVHRSSFYISFHSNPKKMSMNDIEHQLELFALNVSSNGFIVQALKNIHSK